VFQHPRVSKQQTAFAINGPATPLCIYILEQSAGTVQYPGAFIIAFINSPVVRHNNSKLATFIIQYHPRIDTFSIAIGQDVVSSAKTTKSQIHYNNTDIQSAARNNPTSTRSSATA